MHFLPWVICVMSLALFLSGAHATPIFHAHRCDTCIGSSQMQGEAIQAGLGTRYVFNVPTGEIRKFYIERYCGSNPQGVPEPTRQQEAPQACSFWSHFILELQVEPEVVDLMIEIREAWVAYGQSFHAHETVTYAELAPLLSGQHAHLRNSDPTAYDFVQDSSTRNGVLNAINGLLDQRANPHTVRSLLRGVITIQRAGIGLRMGLESVSSVRSRIVFGDGSWVMIRVAPANPDRVEYEMGTAVDANGASIPDPSYNPETGVSPGGGYLPGTHHPQDPQRWCNLATTMAGIPCSIGGAGGGGMGGIVCGRVNGGPLQCTWT